MQHSTLVPDDKYNQQLRSNVHPVDWRNPKPTGRYNLVVIGAGTAGLVTAAGAAGLGAKVALVERGLMGGDCLNAGCVPSKAIIAAARTAAAVRRAGHFGIEVPPGTQTNFAVTMERMRRIRAEISPIDSAQRFTDLGVDVYFGSARFADSGSIDVDGTRLEFSRAVIATGARAAAPPIPGIETVPYLTNETLFSITELPTSLGVVGAGPIGCEMAQAFAQLGSKVFLVEAQHGILPREDPAAAEVVKQAMLADGVQLLCCGKHLQLRHASRTHLSVDSHGQHYDLPVDQVLVSVGRAPNVQGMGLEQVGVQFDDTGVKVDDQLRTTNRRILAAGDVCSRYQFTHAADYMARMVIQNALFKGRAKLSKLVIPWCTYTSPELAHVGLDKRQADVEGVAISTFTQQFSDVDRALLDGASTGFAEVHVKQGTDRIVGATIVAPNAGDLIAEVTLAMTGGLGLGKIAGTIHPYPTHADAIRKLGDQYNRTRLTPLVAKALRTWLKWTR